MKNYTIQESIPDSKYPNISKLRVDFKSGISIEVLSYGIIIQSLEVPDKNGKKENIVLNHNFLHEYFTDQVYLGCIVGRYANRIGKGTFPLNEKEYRLSLNHGDHHLHGGFDGFNKKVWNIKSVEEENEKITITFEYFSSDGEEGYPGNLSVEVKYVLSCNELQIQYLAETDQDTIFNPTNHSYFNLSGDLSSKIDDHFLRIDSSKVLSTKGQLIPDGNHHSVDNTHFDFRKARRIGLDAYDDCYVLEGGIVLSHQASGRKMMVTTSFPSCQLYTGEYLSKPHPKRAGVCLETQFYPDSPNHPEFPSVVLRKGESFKHYTKYQFGKLS